MVLELHSNLSNTIWLFFLILGVWGIYRALRGQPVDGSYLGALVIGQALFVVQAILGGILWLNGGRPAEGGMHILYGVFAVVFLPFLFAYMRGDDTNRAQWVYGLANLFLFGIALRAAGTAMY